MKPLWQNFCVVLLLFQDFTKTGSFFDEEGGDCFSDHYYIRNEYRKSVKRLAMACVFPKNMASLRADTLNLVYRTISNLYAIRGPAAPQAKHGTLRSGERIVCIIK